MMQRIRLGHPYDLVEKVVPDLEEALSLNFDSEEERNAHRAEYENTIAELKEANKRIAHFATLIAGTLPSKKLGFSEKASVSIFNPAEKLLVIAGSPSIGTIVNSIADASNHFLATTTDALPLGRSHVLTDAKGEGSVLFGHPQAVRDGATPPLVMLLMLSNRSSAQSCSLLTTTRGVPRVCIALLPA